MTAPVPEIRLFRVIVLREGNWFVAQALEQDVASQAKSLVDVIINLGQMFNVRDKCTNVVAPPPAPPDYSTAWESGIDLGVCVVGDMRTFHVRLAQPNGV